MNLSVTALKNISCAQKWMRAGRYMGERMDRKNCGVSKGIHVIFSSSAPIAKPGMVLLQQKTFCLPNFISSPH